MAAVLAFNNEIRVAIEASLGRLPTDEYSLLRSTSSASECLSSSSLSDASVCSILMTLLTALASSGTMVGDGSGAFTSSGSDLITVLHINQ